MRVDFPSSTEPITTRRSNSLCSCWRRYAVTSLRIRSVSRSNIEIAYRKPRLEVAFAFLELHRAFFVVVNHPALPFAVGRQQHLADDFRQGGCRRAHGTRQRVATQGPETD